MGLKRRDMGTERGRQRGWGLQIGKDERKGEEKVSVGEYNRVRKR